MKRMIATVLTALFVLVPAGAAVAEPIHIPSVCALTPLGGLCPDRS